MRILVIGSGGREHTLCWKLSQSPRVTELFTAPGNPGTARVPKNTNMDIAATDIHALVNFASTEGIDLTIVGPEQPLADGIVDRFHDRNMRIFGPTQAAAQLESSKGFAKEMMNKAGTPTATFEMLSSPAQARQYLSKATYPLVLKADGLAAGKGVRICPDSSSASTFVEDVMEKKIFGNSGTTVVAEEFLEGEEASFLILAHGTDYIPLAGAQDHKRLEEGDRGPNTGGMGAYSPAPIFTPEMQALTEKTIVRPLLATMSKEGMPFTGVLYLGLMISKGVPKVLEFNVRFGDPEAQAVLPRLDDDLAELIDCAARGKLKHLTPKWTTDAAMTVVLASEGYPVSPQKGKIVEGVDRAETHAHVFHAGTKTENDRLITSGGRVFGVTGIGKTLQDARDRAYRAADLIQYPGKVYRRDIGWRAFERNA